jgi:hypothetical protein
MQWFTHEFRSSVPHFPGFGVFLEAVDVEIGSECTHFGQADHGQFNPIFLGNIFHDPAPPQLTQVLLVLVSLE